MPAYFTHGDTHFTLDVTSNWRKVTFSMIDNAQTLHPDAHEGSFLLYSISLGLKVEDTEEREKDGDEHYSNRKPSCCP